MGAEESEWLKSLQEKKYDEEISATSDSVKTLNSPGWLYLKILRKNTIEVKLEQICLTFPVISSFVLVVNNESAFSLCAIF